MAAPEDRLTFRRARYKSRSAFRLFSPQRGITWIAKGRSPGNLQGVYHFAGSLKGTNMSEVKMLDRNGQRAGLEPRPLLPQFPNLLGRRRCSRIAQTLVAQQPIQDVVTLGNILVVRQFGNQLPDGLCRFSHDPVFP